MKNIDTFAEALYKLMHDYEIDFEKQSLMINTAKYHRVCQIPKTKLSPDWSTAPSWANWWARNPDGRAAWAECKPIIKDGYGFLKGEAGRCIECFLDDWENSLQERPR